MAAMILEQPGYAVLMASTPNEAITLARENPGEIHLLLTDVIMPDLKILSMSGYTADVIANRASPVTW